MLFKNLTSSKALALQQYVDIDQFRESERYVCAESVPLAAASFSVRRASLAFPSCTLSLVRTFPRLIYGYELSGRFVIVIPMNDVASARINGRSIGQSLLLLKGSTNCIVHEPEGRLVAILSIAPDALDPQWLDLDDGELLIRLEPAKLAHIQVLIKSVLEFAAREPDAIRATDILRTMQYSLLETLGVTMNSGESLDAGNGRLLRRYRRIVDRIDEQLEFNPTDSIYSDLLAREIGVSQRTVHAAVNALCGLSTLRYVRLRRLWSVRSQLRSGAPGLTVQASALAHGFFHMGEFSGIYRATFGELPSQTLAHARR
jgi:AraC family ethanolamine operon transcriptional activator